MYSIHHNLDVWDNSEVCKGSVSGLHWLLQMMQVYLLLVQISCLHMQWEFSARI